MPDQWERRERKDQQALRDLKARRDYQEKTVLLGLRGRQVLRELLDRLDQPGPLDQQALRELRDLLGLKVHREKQGQLDRRGNLDQLARKASRAYRDHKVQRDL
jgi:hypothetical protein